LEKPPRKEVVKNGKGGNAILHMKSLKETGGGTVPKRNPSADQAGGNREKKNPLWLKKKKSTKQATD